TSNNTIFGTQWHDEPASNAPLVCDASSDILSRPIDLERYGLIYAGAQKNLGPAGVTLVLVRNDLLVRTPATVPTMIDYNTHAAKKSLYNTPPSFGIYVMGLVAAWVEAEGGLAAMAQRNEAKARRLYEAIDGSDVYQGTAEVESRSLMNVTFTLADPSLEGRFLEEAKARGMVGLKGHRSVGGFRASIYNAMPAEGVDALCAFMEEFASALV
ncbi:MAG: 3-phosphoserine/phosphohydroxythreonine transaminase, partial [Planctomycetota bacterium]